MAKNRVPSFFKVLINDFTRQLKLPPYLALKHGEILPDDAKLRTSSGKKWDVKIEQTEDGDRCFTRGWSEFVRDMKLVEGDYVCFFPDSDEITFDVCVFGTNFNEKQMPVFDSPVKSYDADHDRVKNKQKEKNEAASLHFEMLLKEWQKPRLPLRKGFVEKAHLIGKEEVIMEYAPTKRTLEVSLDNRTQNAFKFELARGWQDFQKENGLKVGKTYSFTFNQARNVIQVQPVKKNSRGKK